MRPLDQLLFKTPANYECVAQGEIRGHPCRVEPERLGGKPTPPERQRGFLDSTERAATARSASPGLGEDVRLSGEGVLGSGLELKGELLQLCAVTSRGPEGRLARPSRRAA
jgi:hypothetical protein